MNTMSTLAFHLTGFKSMNNSLKKIKCLIVEDEPNAQELLQDHIELTPSLTLVGVASNVQEAIQLCIEQKPDLLLLDIQMPRFSGFDLLDVLPKPVPFVIITTAHKKYAIKGYEHAVVDFLLKPVSYEKFALAVQRVEGQMGISRSDFESTIDEAYVEKTSRILIVKEGRVDKKIPYESIDYLEADDNYVKIHLLKSAKGFIMTKNTTTKLASLLPEEEFFRINRSYVVRVDQVSKATPASIKLFSGQELPVGPKYKSHIKDFFAYLTSSI